MLQLIKTGTMFRLAILLLLPMLSFTIPSGGDSFEVYLGKKLITRQQGSNGAITQLQLDQTSINDQVDVYYSHCGQSGTARVISIRDEQNSMLREWHFHDSPGVKTSMSLPVKDIVALQHKTAGNLQLYYSAHELPTGRLLATISVPVSARSGR